MATCGLELLLNPYGRTLKQDLVARWPWLERVSQEAEEAKKPSKIESLVGNLKRKFSPNSH
jgi:hypothetical protein